VREVYNTLHMDIIAVPLALAAVLLWVGKSRIAAILSLVLAVGSKLWPIVLLPILLLPLLGALRRNVAALAAFGGGCSLILAPQLLSQLDATSGLLAYGKSWEMNDALYMLFLWAGEWFGAIWAWDSAQVQIVTRVVVACSLAGLILWSCRHPARDGAELWARCLLAVAALFLLSPTQFPWYYLWVVPFLVMRYRFSLVLLSVLLSLYYVRFFFQARDNVYIFDAYLVWVEYVPVGVVLAYEWLAKRRSAHGSLEEYRPVRFTPKAKL